MSDSKEKKIVGGVGAAATGVAAANVAYQAHREDTKTIRRREKLAKEYQKKLDANTREINKTKVNNLQKKLERLESVKNKKPFNQSKFLGSDNKLKKDLNLQIKNLKNQISDLKPNNFVKGIKTAVKLAKSVTPVSAFLAMLTPSKTATDKQMKEQTKKMKNKNNTDYRKGGMILYSVDNRKKR